MIDGELGRDSMRDESGRAVLKAHRRYNRNVDQREALLYVVLSSRGANQGR